MKTRTRITLAGLVLGATLAGGVAWATIPSANGTIHGCYKTGVGGVDDPNKGQLRVVDSASDCKNNEAAISWNEKGVPGAVGATGPAGPAGAKGDTGPAGPQGSKGEQGPTGPEGLKGDQGLQGPAGATGPAGQDGAVGPQGASGQNGAAGTEGAQGQPGPQGPQGVKGDTGPSGPAGIGVVWRGPYAAWNAYVENDAVSREGSSYVAKTTVPTGCPPPGQLCSDDYAPPNATYWSVLAQKGQAGQAGAQGPQGPSGASGPQGAAGPQGSTGPTGPAGPAGVGSLSLVSGPRTRTNIGAFGYGSASSTCPANTVVVGGVFSEEGGTDVNAVHFSISANSYSANAGADIGGGSIVAQALCLTLS